MNVIDALVVELALDPTKYTEEQKKFLSNLRKAKDEALETANDIEHSGKRAAEFYTGINKAATALFTVLAGTGMVEFARATMSSVAATGRLSQNIGISTQEVSAFSRMIERNGGSADEAASSIKNLALQATQFVKYGQASDEFQNFLGLIGGNPFKSALDNYMKFVEFAERHRDDPAFVTLAGIQGGLDQASINEAMKGVRQVRADLEKSRRIGVPDDADAKKLQHLLETWVGVGQAIETAGRNLLVDYSGPLEHVAAVTTEWLDANKKLAETIAAILASIVALNALRPAKWLLTLLGLGSPAAGTLVAGGIAEGIAVQYMNENAQKMGFPEGTTFDPEGGFVMPFDSTRAVPGDKPAPAKRSSQQQAMDYFIAQGWSVNQAAAIVANAQAESGLDPEAFNNAAGPHKGLFQWSKARRDAILSGTGVDVWNAPFEDQLRAAQWELTHTEKASGDALRRSSNASEGAVIIDRMFERSGDTSELEQHRALLAGSLAAGTAGATDASTTVHIDNLIVNTRATDAEGIGRDIQGSLKRAIGRTGFSTTANTGLN